MIKDLRSYFNNNRVFSKELYEARECIVRYFVVNYGTYLSEEDFEDIFQDAVIVMWENYKKGKLTEMTSVKSYLMGVCLNITKKILDRDPTAKGNIRFPDSKDPDEPGIDEGQIAMIIGTTDDDCDKEECFSAIRSAVESFGEKCRQILLSIFWDNLKGKEIAEMMGYSNANVVKTKKGRCMNDFIDKNKQTLKEVCLK